MTEYCRLCAELKNSYEIVTSIDDVEQLMEQKLRACCQWTIENTEQRLPHSVCALCIYKLDKCWLFAQSVQSAQHKLHEIFENEIETGIKPLETVIISQIFESADYSNNFPSVSTVECNATLAETNNKSIEGESKAEDFKPIVVGSTNFQDDIESDDYQWFDSDDASNHSESIQTVPNKLEQQHPGKGKIEPRQKKEKPKNKTEKTKQSKEKLPNNKQYACEECDQTFSSTTNLKKHRHMHSGQKPFECRLCNKTYLAQYALNQHLLSHVQRSKGALKIEETSDGVRIIQPNGDDSIKINGKIWKCDQCDRVFTQKYKRKEHQMLQHSGQLPFECWLCHKLYKTHGRVKAHIKTHIKDGIKLNWICELCAKGFGGPKALANHTQMIHSTERPWRCEMCGLGFKVECQLRRHLLIHTDVQHKCTQCEKTFRTTYSLKKHIETHTGTIPRPFVCDFCKMGFRHKMDLKEHRRIHTGEKPYQCERCLSNFRAASTFYNHMRKVHGISMSDRKKKYMAE